MFSSPAFLFDRILCNAQNYLKNFVKKIKIMLDKHTARWYDNRACVGELCPARTAMMQEIASKDGNFCGVCPVIGRLNYFRKRLRISLRQ